MPLSVATGVNFSCMLATTGEVHCWGSNTFGSLGIGAPSEGGVPDPVEAIRLANVRQLDAEQNHACAVTVGGQLYCWGNNDRAQLGTNDRDPRSTPTFVQRFVDDHVVEVATGRDHSCARLDDGDVYCWGSNRRGQIGTGDFSFEVMEPTFTGITDAVQVSVGSTHSCALLRDSGVMCWGSGDQGELGSGLSADQPWPTRIPSLGNVLEVAAGGDHTCVRRANEVLCWGRNDRGQLGRGSRGAAVGYPQQVPNFVATEIAAAPGQTCALDAAGTPHCWGVNDLGQAGVELTGDRLRPTRVDGF